jgi:hypothetical protein
VEDAPGRGEFGAVRQVLGEELAAASGKCAPKVRESTGDEVVDHHDATSRGEEFVDEMGADEPAPAGDDEREILRVGPSAVHGDAATGSV